MLGALGAASCVTGGGGGRGDGGGSDGGGATLLPVDCRHNDDRQPADFDPNCAPYSGAPTGTVGTGAAFGDTFYDGFVDGNRVIFSNGDSLSDFRAVYSLDPATKVRTVISGTYTDPRTGRATVGSGPTISEVHDAAKGPDGYYFFVHDSDHTTGTWEAPEIPDPVIVRVDPATGNRTEALDFGAAGARCTTRSGTALYPNKVLVISSEASDYLSFDVAHDGTIYVGVQHDENLGEHTWGGIAAFRNGHCQLVSVDDSADVDDVGTGYQLTDSPNALRVYGNTAYLIPHGMYAIMAVDLTTGNRTIISHDETNIGSGPPVHPTYLQIAPDGTLWTAGGNVLDSLWCAIDPRTGNRTGYAPHGDGGPHDGRPIYGVDPTRPFLYLADDDTQLAVFEYTTSNYNILAW